MGFVYLHVLRKFTHTYLKTCLPRRDSHRLLRVENVCTKSALISLKPLVVSSCKPLYFYQLLTVVYTVMLWSRVQSDVEPEFLVCGPGSGLHVHTVQGDGQGLGTEC